MEIVFYNGEFVAEKDVSISSNSRVFNYGDGFFETIKIINSKPFNFECHIQRIQLALSVLKLNENYAQAFFQKIISNLLMVNRIVNGSVKIHVSRNGIGKYLPKSNNANLFISASNGFAYKLNDPISLCFYNEDYKTTGVLSNIKSVNSLVSILASIHAYENNFDNALLLNTSGNVIEATNANIFIVNNEKIYTPPLSEGCIDGTMRKWVSNELDIIEKSILSFEILDADEVFVTNASSGVTSIKIIEKTSFSSFETAIFLQKKLTNLNLDL